MPRWRLSQPRCSTRSPRLGLLHGLALRDDGLIAAWRARLAAFPDQLAEAMAEHHLRVFSYWRWADHVAHRDARLWAELLGLSRSEVYRMAERGELPSTRVSETAVRIPKAELVVWLRERTRGAVTDDRQPPRPRLTIVSENRKPSRRAARR